MMEQLRFDFSQNPSYTETDFIVSDHNHLAWEWIRRWPNWPSYGLVLYGPPGCGKTHLGHIWTKRTGAIIIDDPNQIDFLKITSPVFLDISRHTTTEHNIQPLFHLLNHCAIYSFPILITSALTPGAWYMHLPDIRSRLQALPNIAMGIYGDQAYAIIQKWLIDNYLPCHSPKVLDLLAETYRLEPDFLAFVLTQRQNTKKPLSLAATRHMLNLYYEQKEKNSLCLQT